MLLLAIGLIVATALGIAAFLIGQQIRDEESRLSTQGLAMAAMLAEVADEEEDHPDIDIRYNKVRLVLATHSKGGLTELDFGLAERIDTLAE